MRHNNSTVLAISRTPNPTQVFQKTLGLNDFYFGSDDWEFPLGHIQMVGKSNGTQIKGEGFVGNGAGHATNAGRGENPVHRAGSKKK